jgi:uncharacterized metal-binding protein YceD (DUF177 family)
MRKDDINPIPWSRPITVDEVPESGRHIAIAADAPTREAIAKVAPVLAIPALNAAFELTRYGRDGVRVVGRVTANVKQECVVTLDPIESEVDESINLVFAPQNAVSFEPADAIDPPDDPPESLRDGIIDLGAIATEFLILGIDPYPRKPGAVYHAPQTEENAAGHPFAALAALKKDQPG